MQRSKKRKVVRTLIEAIKHRHDYANDAYLVKCWNELRRVYKKGFRSFIPDHVDKKIKEAYRR